MSGVWAPRAQRVELVTADQRLDLDPAPGGWWRSELALPVGADYAFSLDGGPPRPDPRGPSLPNGVHGPSRTVDHAAFGWTDGAWRGFSLAGAVLYELHVGTFTEAGTFDAAIERLDHLVDLGVAAVELLPCNAFDGRWGWGYDGVSWFAVHEPYGGSEGLKRLVDACHARGLGVVMDVVYNHLGPSGNYLPEFGPYLTDEHRTPWGPAVNLDQPGSDEVRRYILDSALMWLRDYHCDGLRLDATHALVDSRATTLLEELVVEVRAAEGELRRTLVLIAESDRNDPRVVMSQEAGGTGLDAQWADDVHHALHALLTGERGGYYGDFGSLPTLAKALTGVFVHDGCWSSFRGRSHGRPVPAALSGERFVVFLQDHDQVGNRATGDRIASTVSDDLLKVGAGLLLTGAGTPMLFMGEEWGSRRPWCYFSDHPGSLGDAVRAGRRQEFAAHGWAAQQIPDPQSPATVAASTLDWSELSETRCVDLLSWTRSLLALRRSRPELSDGRRDGVRVTFDEQRRWLVSARGRVSTVVNLSEDRQLVPVEDIPGRVLLASRPGFSFGPDGVETDGHSVVVVECVPQEPAASRVEASSA